MMTPPRPFNRFSGFYCITRTRFFSYIKKIYQFLLSLKVVTNENQGGYGIARWKMLGTGLGPQSNKNPIRVFPSWEMRGRSPYVHIHVSVSDLYLLRIGSHISYSKIGRSVVGIYKSFTDT